MAVTDPNYPTGNGATSNWTASAGNKYDCVSAGTPRGANEPDDDTTYISASGADYIVQMFTFAAFAIDSSAIEKITLTIRAKDSNATRTLISGLRVNDTNYDHASLIYPTTSWATVTRDWTVNPATAAAWVEADVEGTGTSPLQLFYVYTDVMGGETEYITQAYLTVTYTPAATAQYARPAADRTDGNWLNASDSNTNLYASLDETTADDDDYIKSGAAPSQDTCTIDLSSIATPQAGTVNLRVRAKYL